CDHILEDWQRVVSDSGWQGLQTLWVLPLLSADDADRNRRLSQAVALLRFMESSNAGMQASLSMDTNGIWMHLLKLALAIYTGQWPLASRLLNYAPLRFIAQQTRNAAGAPPALADHIAQANAWVLLARLSALAGLDLACYRGVHGESIQELLAEIERTGSDTPEWQALPEHHRCWLAAVGALLQGDSAPPVPLEAAHLMPLGWQLLTETV
ncbi:MAG: hypothetical protein ACO25T_07025, partial [Arenimonas sp.]|uniref:hypothetical protein n=1 Tax=Arenimonas sp. TaxID=1872635 RepID=UPI003C0B70DC